MSCEGLPESWKEMTTETPFPLSPGSEVTLTCSADYTLTGDTTVTCTEGREFSFTEAPLCAEGLSTDLSFIAHRLYNFLGELELAHEEHGRYKCYSPISCLSAPRIWPLLHCRFQQVLSSI